MELSNIVKPVQNRDIDCVLRQIRFVYQGAKKAHGTELNEKELFQIEKMQICEKNINKGDITQKGYEKKRSKLIGAYLPQPPGEKKEAHDIHTKIELKAKDCKEMLEGKIEIVIRKEEDQFEVCGLFEIRTKCRRVDQALPQERRTPVTPSSSSRYHRRRSSGSRDERYRSDKKHKLLVSLFRPVNVIDIGVERADVHTEAVQAALAKHKERKMAVPMPSKRRSLVVQTSMDAYTPPENHSAPPDVTTYTSEHSIQVERPQGSTARVAPKYGNAELMETGDGVPVSSRVSAKIQQLVNTLKRPKRPPLREFFVDDFEELLEGKLWTRSMKVAYNILHKLGTKQEPMVRPGDRVTLVFPNNDPAAFMVAFYGCLLAEVVPVPIEVPLTRKCWFRDSTMYPMEVLGEKFQPERVSGGIERSGVDGVGEPQLGHLH
ncbi:hypothetical protein BTVI_147542 [Pitangus sulphuratus]|nr:hypothetical protein BTVI_147542 [Pitangus sulphuratus]